MIGYKANWASRYMYLLPTQSIISGEMHDLKSKKGFTMKCRVGMRQESSKRRRESVGCVQREEQNGEGMPSAVTSIWHLWKADQRGRTSDPGAGLTRVGTATGEFRSKDCLLEKIQEEMAKTSALPTFISMSKNKRNSLFCRYIWGIYYFLIF